MHVCMRLVGVFFFFKQKTAYEMRISDWSSDVCSSDLAFHHLDGGALQPARHVVFPDARGERQLRREEHGGRVAEADGDGAGLAAREIGRASCRERVCQYV